MQCPCQSGKAYSNCCEPYLKGENIPATAEQLMRSRYTAFTQCKMDYIESTHHPKTRSKFDQNANREWAEAATWHGLEVLSTVEGDADSDWGQVEFIAKYDVGEGVEAHHELSDFRKLEGQWYFSDSSKPKGSTVVNDNKVGRNDPCPCGSGKKFKKCCANATVNA